jgi:hypothetical protein
MADPTNKTPPDSWWDKLRKKHVKYKDSLRVGAVYGFVGGIVTGLVLAIAISLILTFAVLSLAAPQILLPAMLVLIGSMAVGSLLGAVITSVLQKMSEPPEEPKQPAKNNNPPVRSTHHSLSNTLGEPQQRLRELPEASNVSRTVSVRDDWSGSEPRVVDMSDVESSASRRSSLS